MCYSLYLILLIAILFSINRFDNSLKYNINMANLDFVNKFFITSENNLKHE